MIHYDGSHPRSRKEKSSFGRWMHAACSFRIHTHIIAALLLCSVLAACDRQEESHYRPENPWAFRSVLDRKPRMLTIALDSSCYIAYDLGRCTLYKAWKGGVLMEGTAYTDKKNVQPTSWGAIYQSDSLNRFGWEVEVDGRRATPRMLHKGYRFKNGGIQLNFAMVLPSGDTVLVIEQPEFVRSTRGEPGLQRKFDLLNVPAGTRISIATGPNDIRELDAGKKNTLVWYFDEPPAQFPPKPDEGYDHRGRYFMEKSDCMTCHEVEQSTVGPSLREIAQRYPREKTAMQYLVRKVRQGGSGVWGQAAMNAHPNLSEREITEMLSYILSLRPAEEKVFTPVVRNKKVAPVREVKPGFGAPLQGVHPGFDLHTIRKNNFTPRVGGLAFLPDGRLLVTTWDKIGGVYLLDGVETSDTSRIDVKLIASGLSEPLGIEVVDGEIYVLQKHELTRLVDHDGDEIIDEYEAVCNSWGVTDDFHEFAFGLVYKDGYFYAALSMAMRLMSHERQHPDRGRTIRIHRNGTYEGVNYGLRTPNGIGIGPDDQLFVTDNQGEWTPANKLIHVKQGEFLGMPWALPDGKEIPPVSPPAIWLPQDEIGNSPTEPVLIHDGPYKGQLLHGDVTHGGIKRDFLEKVNGHYQGAVFRFSQGLEAGVNRLRWGPDGALYVGGVGMVGGWSWKEKQYGLQKLVYNGKPVFEMLAVRARPQGFEIEMTEPLSSGATLAASDIQVQQWRYERTSAYGGPKVDLRTLPVTDIRLSSDQRRISLKVDGLKSGHVVYFRLPDDLKSSSGAALWSSEAWYTLNHIPAD